MMKLNNKGQSLVIFILIIPILIGIMALVFDVGNVYVKKNEIDNVLELVLDYGLESKEIDEEVVDDDTLEVTDNRESTDNDESIEYLEDDLVNREETLKVLLNYNLKNSQNEVTIQDGIIILSSKTYVEGIFSRILNFKGFEIESEYKGYIENNKKVIEKIK